MTINYKNQFIIFHHDGNFTEDQIRKLLDAAYDLGYNAGYETGKKLFNITYTNSTPVPTQPWHYTTTSMNSDNISLNKSITVDQPKTLEFMYNGTEK